MTVFIKTVLSFLGKIYNSQADNMSKETQRIRLLKRWIAKDPEMMRIIKLVEHCKLPDWWIAAGFVRNKVWNELHGYPASGVGGDVDVIYYDPTNLSPDKDRAIEEFLRGKASSVPWSVKNQARMHLHNGDAQYQSSRDAISHWVEIPTCVAVTLKNQMQLEILAPYGLKELFELRLTPNKKYYRPKVFKERVASKHWLERWPKLRLEMRGMD